MCIALDALLRQGPLNGGWSLAAIQPNDQPGKSSYLETAIRHYNIFFIRVNLISGLFFIIDKSFKSIAKQQTASLRPTLIKTVIPRKMILTKL